MAQLKGITVTLINKLVVGEDPFGAPITEDREIPVSNVLIAPTSAEDIVNHQTVSGKTAIYTLAIPKGDKHNWTNAEVRFFGERWQTIGTPAEGIEEMMPLKWNRKIQVERYE